jgi:uncharacterized membrane protein
MPDTLTCPRCQRRLRLREDDADALLTCPRCLAYVPNPGHAGQGRSGFDRDFRLDNRGGSVLMLVLAGLLVVGGFGLAFAAPSLASAAIPNGTVVLVFAAMTIIPVVLGSLLLYATGAYRSFTKMGPVAGTVVLMITLGALVVVSAVIVLFAACFYSLSRL